MALVMHSNPSPRSRLSAPILVRAEKLACTYPSGFFSPRGRGENRANIETGRAPLIPNSASKGNRAVP